MNTNILLIETNKIFLIVFIYKYTFTNTNTNILLQKVIQKNIKEIASDIAIQNKYDNNTINYII